MICIPHKVLSTDCHNLHFTHCLYSFSHWFKVLIIKLCSKSLWKKVRQLKWDVMVATWPRMEVVFDCSKCVLSSHGGANNLHTYLGLRALWWCHTLRQHLSSCFGSEDLWYLTSLTQFVCDLTESAMVLKFVLDDSHTPERKWWLNSCNLILLLLLHMCSW